MFLDLLQAGGASAAGICAASLPGAEACVAATGHGESFCEAGECRALGSLVCVSREISTPLPLELSALPHQRPALGSVPSSGTHGSKAFVPIPFQFLPLSGPQFPDLVTLGSSQHHFQLTSEGFMIECLLIISTWLHSPSPEWRHLSREGEKS